jgi:DNA primase large subunit
MSVWQGLELEDALVFFESHFGKVMTHDQFVKDYSYSLRHMYGKEGARKNYTPFSCMKIILGVAPQPGQVHGCPYK